MPATTGCLKNRTGARNRTWRLRRAASRPADIALLTTIAVVLSRVVKCRKLSCVTLGYIELTLQFTVMTIQISETTYFTNSEAAKRARVSRQTLWRWRGEEDSRWPDIPR